MSIPNRFTCVGGPFDGHTVQYPGTPKVIVLMEHPFVYHDYRQIGDTNHYRYIERQP